MKKIMHRHLLLFILWTACLAGCGAGAGEGEKSEMVLEDTENQYHFLAKYVRKPDGDR